MKSLFAIAATTFMVLGAAGGSAFACPYKDQVTASTPSSPSTSTNQTAVDEG